MTLTAAAMPRQASSPASQARVARGAHKKALGLTPPPFTWEGWKVSGELRGNNDKYVAAKGSKRVRWRF